ncbi:hypothetical protein DL93DRAFT_2096471 [Clavulina sp. PMI_390]|nr:hypothetical protein DL93DRAFT_2096471 [Clavulina sp. PMI_390]
MEASAPLRNPDSDLNLLTNAIQNGFTMKETCFVDRLPAETLGDIFSLAIRSVGGMSPEWSVFRTTWRSLLNTSRFWNDVAMNEPNLWSEAHFSSEPQWMSDMLSVFLQRSGSVALDVYLHQAILHGIRVPIRNQEMEGITKAGLFDHFERIRFLYFSCPSSKFFPLAKPTPNLECLVVRALDSHAATSTTVPSHILSSPPSSLTTLHIGWGTSLPDPFLHVDLTKIETLSFPRTWTPTFIPQFVSRCNNLKRLHLPYDALKMTPKPLTPNELLNLPQLESLRLQDACPNLPHYFGALPNLRELIMVAGYIGIDQDADGMLLNFFMPRFGPSLQAPNGDVGGDTNVALADPWPMMPLLEHLVIQHVHAADLIHPFRTSPELQSVRIHANVGFCELFRALAGVSSSNDGGIQADRNIPEAASLLIPHVPKLVPNLQSLLIFPQINLYDCDLATFGAEEEIDDVMPLIDLVLDNRPSLVIEIGYYTIVDYEAPWDGELESRWQHEDLLPFVQDLEEPSKDGASAAESPGRRLRNASRVRLVKLEDPPYIPEDPSWFDL